MLSPHFAAVSRDRSSTFPMFHFLTLAFFLSASTSHSLPLDFSLSRTVPEETKKERKIKSLHSTAPTAHQTSPPPPSLPQSQNSFTPSPCFSLSSSPSSPSQPHTSKSSSPLPVATTKTPSPPTHAGAKTRLQAFGPCSPSRAGRFS